MRRLSLLLTPLILGVALLTLVTHQTPPLAASPAAPQADLPPAGFAPDNGSVRSTVTDTLMPAIIIPNGAVEPWVAAVQSDRLYVSRYLSDSASWAQQGGILNRGSANPASAPTLALAGADNTVPWAAWREDVGGLGLINASFFNGTTWNLTPIANRDPSHNAQTPALASGLTPGGSEPLPWLAWAEENSSGVPQIVVSYAVPDTRLQGGFDWETAGDPLNLDSTRDGMTPDLAIAGDEPWIVWSETGGDTAARVYAKRWNGTTWSAVGRQEGCDSAASCALNLNANLDAGGARIVMGRLPNQSAPSPWIIFSEVDASGLSAIHVMRLDPGAPADESDDRFVAVGGAVNAQCLGNATLSVNAANNVDVQSAGLRDAGDLADANALSGGNARMPDITFVGNVPHVTWVEEAGGRSIVHVCHLAKAQSGLERWDLDSFDGVNRSSAPASAPALATNGLTPYVTWQEAISTTAAYVSHREPLSAAWAINFPATVNNIADVALTAEEQRALRASWGDSYAAGVDAPLLRSNAVPIVTAAYHINGSDVLEEVHFQLSSSEAPTATAAFMARYVISENLVYVQDPENPGTYFPPVAPGATTNVNTPIVTLQSSGVEVNSYGSGSAALDVRWSLIFENATFFKQYEQAVNVIFDGGQETGFHSVGTVYVGNQVYLSIILNENMATETE